ncbi:hypothetical protein A8B75_19010 [Sphingomonadales bacterium EhC05]|nr:hypothetical protein A8B75_19010 [Sphingomonadales bacterium EhC05]
MLEFKLTNVEEQPYLYEERSCSRDPSDISATMGGAFQNVMDFLSSRQISPIQVLAVYYTYDPDRMSFRAGFTVSPDAVTKADGAVKAAVTPAGQVLTFTHVGPYSELRHSYGLMMEYIEKNGLKLGAPTWEIYVDDPQVTPPEQLKTEIFVSLA